MTTLRKNILRYKIQEIGTHCNFVLFFQHNNIKNKQWTLLKNQILNLQNTSIMVCKNKLTYKFYKPISYISSEKSVNFSENFSYKSKKTFSHEIICNDKKQNEKNVLHFFCQGPTLIIGFKYIYECKIICDVLNIFKRNATDVNNIANNLNYSVNKIEKINLNYVSINVKTPEIFNQRKQHLDLVFKSKLHSHIETANTRCCCIYCSQNTSMPVNPLLNNTSIPDFFFVGGFAENQVIDHLDLKVLYKLTSKILFSKMSITPNNFLYSNLIEKLYTPVKLLLILSLFEKIKLLKCFNYNNKNLISILKSKNYTHETLI